MICPHCGKETDSLIEEYSPVVKQEGQTTTTNRAVPKLYDRRERFKKRETRLDEITARPTMLEVQNPQIVNDPAFIGEGVRQEL